MAVWMVLTALRDTLMESRFTDQLERASALGGVDTAKGELATT